MKGGVRPSDAEELPRVPSTTRIYGSIRRTHSHQGLHALPRSAAGSNSSLYSEDGGSSSAAASHVSRTSQVLSRQNSFHRQGSFADLPLVALPGLTTRVSVGNMTSASSQDLQTFFQTDDPHSRFHIEAVTVEGGWTLPLMWSTLGALLSALCFGYNNGNMNTQAAVMRDALGIPSHVHEGCPFATGTDSPALPANDVIWGFCVSGFCLSALFGSTFSGQLADRHGRRSFLLGNSVLYLVAGMVEAASGLVRCDAADPAQREQQFCAPVPCVGALGLLLLGRLLTGVACGGSTVVVPMYLGEIAPAHLRGTLGSAFLLTAVTGMLFGQVAGLPLLLGTAAGWPYLLAAVALPALVQLLLFAPMLVESPRWLLLHGKLDSARAALARLRGCDENDFELVEELDAMGEMGGDDLVPPDGGGGVRGLGSLAGSASMLSRLGGGGGRKAGAFDADLLEPMMGGGGGGGGGGVCGGGGGKSAISSAHPSAETLPRSNSGLISLRSSHATLSTSSSSAALQLLLDPTLRRPLLICVTLMAAQQLSGINNAFNYSSTFFVANGLSEEVVTWIAVSMNVGNVLVVLLSTCLMDRLGRRLLLLSSMCGMILSIGLLSAALVRGYVPLVVVGIVLFVGSFGLGLGPVVWLLPAELFPMSRRASATAAVTCVNWLANFAVGQSFPLIAGVLGPWSFVPFGAVLLLALIFAYQSVPETRGRTLEEIERMMVELRD